MRPARLIPLAILVALATTPVATAAKPTQEIFPLPTDEVFTDQCAFPVLIHIEGDGVITTFTDADGNLVAQNFRFPSNKTALTNLDTGKSVTLSTTGPASFRVDPDGSASFQIIGRSVFVGHPITEAQGIFLIKGRLFVTFDAEGNRTSIEFDGTVVDVCAQLAS